jgi:hypothetical protein
MRDEGILTFYNLQNTAQSGQMPKQQLVSLEIIGYYANKTIGFNRMYAAKGANCRIDALLRCYNTQILEGMVVIPNDGTQYQVDASQKVIGKDAVDITLVKVDKLYEIYAEPTS